MHETPARPQASAETAPVASVRGTGPLALARRWPLLAGLVVTLLLVGLSIAFVDRPLALAIHAETLQMTPLRRFFGVATHLGDELCYYLPAVLVPLGVYLLSRTQRFAGLRAHVARAAWSGVFVLAALLSSGAVVIVMKVLLGRLRPEYLFADGVYAFHPFTLHMKMLSFPSGHTQVAVSAMTALYLLYPRPAPLYFAVGLLVAVSRVYLTAHYAGDVIMGAYVAIAFTVLVHRRMTRAGKPLYGRVIRNP